MAPTPSCHKDLHNLHTNYEKNYMFLSWALTGICYFNLLKASALQRGLLEASDTGDAQQHQWVAISYRPRSCAVGRFTSGIPFGLAPKCTATKRGVFLC